MEKPVDRSQCTGQTLVEYVVVFGLICIIVASVLIGVGQRMRLQFASLYTGFDEERVVARITEKGSRDGRADRPPSHEIRGH
jgi:Flp pilus assembly pilin Flp